MSAASRFRARVRAEQSGLTLIELMVTALLLGLVIAVIGGIMISLLTTERTVASVTTDTRTAQLMADAIGTPVRNSSSFRVTAVGTSDQLVVARVASSTATITWRCTAWYYSASTQQVRTTTRSSAITTPNTATLATWTLLGEGVQKRGTVPVFAASGPLLTVSYQVAKGDTTPVLIAFTAVRLTGIQESTACF